MANVYKVLNVSQVLIDEQLMTRWQFLIPPDVPASYAVKLQRS